jgi:hypothetical protein
LSGFVLAREAFVIESPLRKAETERIGRNLGGSSLAGLSLKDFRLRKRLLRGLFASASPDLSASGTSLAEGVGFEPTRDFHPCRFSRPVLLTAQPPLQALQIMQPRGQELFPEPRLSTLLKIARRLKDLETRPSGSGGPLRRCYLLLQSV